MKATKQIFRLHHWCGLIVGIVLLFMSITGSLLVFSDEMEAIEEKNMPTVPVKSGTPSFDVSFKTVQARYPGWEVRLYHLPKTGEALVYDLRKKEQRQKVYADPVSGEIVGIEENANSSLQRQLLLLHYTWFAGTTGKVLVFCTGVLFFITLLTGLIVYRKAIMKTLTFRVRLNRKTSRSFYSSLHRIIGVWSVLFNLLVVTTGLWLSGNIALTAINPPATKASKPKAGSIHSIDAIVRKLATDHPDFDIHLIRIRPGNNNIGISGRFQSDPSVYGNYYTVFTVNGETGLLQNSQVMKELPVNQRLAKMAGPLHFGNYGGLPLKIVYCLLGLTPGLLSVSGFVLWRKRKPKRKA